MPLRQHLQLLAEQSQNRVPQRQAGCVGCLARERLGSGEHAASSTRPNGDSSVGFSFLPRGYYQLKDKIELPQANAEGIQEFNFVDGTTVWWLTRAGALPFRFVTRREFLHKQIEIVRSRSTPSAGLLAYYQRLLGECNR